MQKLAGARFWVLAGGLPCWSVSAILADEYPSTKSRLFWYAVGSTVAATRVVGRQHFTSDVIVGSAMGYLIGRYVFHARGQRWSK
jgi:membrane-associated phospholipid phosphatase